jgi:hypothetical protein
MTDTQIARLQAVLASLRTMCVEVESMNEQTRARIDRSDELIALMSRTRRVR